MICVGVNHSVNRHQLMYKRKRHPRVEASQMPYSYQAGPGMNRGLMIKNLRLPKADAFESYR